VTGVVRPCDIAGRGPGIVLVHAGIADARMWDPQWELLARDHRVLRLDLGGFGRATLEPGPLCHAADVLATMDRADMPTATIVGASMGGAVSIDLAVAHPERVDALVLVGSALAGRTWSDDLRAAWDAEWEALEAGDLDGATTQAVRFWVDGPNRPEGSAPADVRALVTQMQRTAYELQLPLDGLVDETELAPDAHQRLAELTMPALVVDGAEDVADFRAIARDLVAALPDARAATIADAAHLPSLERPEEFDDVLLAFLLET
jgi:pimeloyl-ACP methyl ester carboxylesterase